jgi:conjugative transfer signal peptidase TraF
MRATGRDLARLAGMLGALGAVAAGVQASGLRWQHTESLPRGLYRLDRDAPIARGSITLWCLDEAWGRWARERGYLTRGRCPGEVEALGKVVLALAGDTVDWAPDGVRLNGRPVARTAPVLTDRAGRSLAPVPYGRYVLAPGSAWVFSPYTIRSLDSRYLGPLPLSRSSGTVRPIWTSRREWPDR